MYKLIDTHAHLDEVDNFADAVERAREAGIIAIVAVGVDYASNNRVLELAAIYPSLVFPALGCHPQNLGETSSEIEHNLKFIADNISLAVAVGEIGLDYHKKVRDRASKELQHRVLTDVLAIAGDSRKPVSLHSRYAWRDCLKIVAGSGISKAVFHWYSGPLSLLSEIHTAGYFTSATPAVAYGAEHADAIRNTPEEKLMLETDTPVVYHRNTALQFASEPADVANRVLEKVAGILNMDSESVAALTTENAIRFFNLPITPI